jgi:hypothetical protein
MMTWAFWSRSRRGCEIGANTLQQEVRERMGGGKRRRPHELMMTDEANGYRWR